MFEFIRTHQRLMMFVLVLFIIPSFAFVGIESYGRFGDAENVVAKVGEQSITQQQLEAAHLEQVERMQQMFGTQIDAKMFDTPEAKKNALDGLIAQRVITAEAIREHMAPSEEQIQASVLASFPSLADPSLSKADRIRSYNEIAQSRGMSVADLQALIAQGMMRQNINIAIQSSAFAPKTVSARLAHIANQEREVQQLLFKSADYASQVKLTEEMLKDYYNKNDSQFSIPEQAKVEYVVLSSDAFAEKIAVDDAEINSFYEQNNKNYEQRRVSHILISFKKEASDQEKSTARAKAENLLAQVRKSPSTFSKLAKEHSQDSSSAEQGGDTGFFVPGMMVPQFEDVSYRLKQGEISDLVQSDFGYHIIQLTEVKLREEKNMAGIRAEITKAIKNQKAAKKFSELAEPFTNMVYEQSDSLKPVADKLNLKIETVENLGRQSNPLIASSVPFNNDKFLKALFSNEAIKNKHNTDAIEVAPNTLIAGRIVEHKPATKRPFSEVESLVRQRVTAIEAEKLAKKAGEAKLAALKEKTDAAGFSATKVVSREKNANIDGAAFPEVMRADVTQLPAFVGVELPGQGYGVYKISKVSQPAAMDKAKLEAQQQQVDTGLAQQEMVAYVDALKQKSKIKILRPIVANPVSVDGNDLDGTDSK